MAEITATEIEDRLEEAALTLRRLPHPPGSGPKGYGSSWPDYVQEAKHAYGYHEATMRVVPSARDIARMEEAIDWLRLVHDPTDRRILWMRAECRRWRAICYRVGLSRSQAWRRWGAAMLTIAKVLNHKNKPRRGAAHAKPRGGKDGGKPGSAGGGPLL